jgi:transposase
MRPYSTDLRARVAAAIDHHEGSLRQIARTFRVSLSFIVRLLQRRHAGSGQAIRAHLRPRWSSNSGPP